MSHAEKPSELAVFTELKPRINLQLQEELKRYGAASVSRHGTEAWRLVEEFSHRPGKRIRGALTVVGYQMFGGTNETVSLKAAAAIELIQNYLLIIDDVMDHSLERRGGPTVQEIYNSSLAQLVANKQSRRHVADMLAINCGLVASHVASQILGSIDCEPAHLLEASNAFHRNIVKTTLGQIDDLYSPFDTHDTSDVLQTHEQKSSYYTFVNPLQVGALLAGATPTDCRAIEEFGVPAGVAFQIQDDILGVFGDSLVTGKSNLDDIREGKVTLLVQHAREKASGDELKTLNNLIGKPDLSESEAERVRSLLKKLGSYDYAVNCARDFTEGALTALGKTIWPEEQRQVLSALMDYIVRRVS